MQTPRAKLKKLESEIARQKEKIKKLEHEKVFKPSYTEQKTFEFFYNSPYGLENTFTGREQELNILDQWIENDNQEPVFILEALGGTGKSALAWHWQSQLHDNIDKHFQNIIWWDLYENDNVNDLINSLLQFLSLPSIESLDDNLKLHKLMTFLEAYPTLIVLDGTERFLRAYHSMGTAYLAESDIRRQARECADPLAANLLVRFSQLRGNSKILMTTRLRPYVLEGKIGKLISGVRHYQLQGLKLEEAQSFFQNLGIKALKSDVEAVCAPLEYHPLSLLLLAGYAAYDPEFPNDLRAAVNYDPTSDLLKKRQHVLQRAYDYLPQKAQDILGRLATIRAGGVSWEVIKAVIGSSRDVRHNLQILELRGLLNRQIQTEKSGKKRTVYDLHPIMRRYAYDRFVNQVDISGSQNLNYFEAVPPPKWVFSLDTEEIISSSISEILQVITGISDTGLFETESFINQSKLKLHPVCKQLYKIDLNSQGGFEAIKQVLDKTISQKQAFFLDDITEIADYKQTNESIRSIAALPIVVQENLKYVLIVHSEEKSFSANDQIFLEMIAYYLGIAIWNVNQFDKVGKREDQIKLLEKVSKLSSEISTNLDMKNLYYTILAQVLNSIPGADNSCIAHFDRLTRRIKIAPESYRFYSVDGWFPGETYEIEINKNYSVVDRVIQNGHSQLINNVSDNPEYLPVISSTQSQICVPIQLSEDERIALVVESNQQMAFTSFDLELLELLAKYISVAIKILFNSRRHVTANCVNRPH